MGSEDFRARVDAAFDLLATRDPAAFSTVAARVRAVREHDRSGAHVEDMTIALARPTFASSSTWLASVLVHETRHLSLYADHLARHPGVAPPLRAYGETEAERTCNAAQRRTLETIGAPRFEIEWLDRQDGSHFDLNANGKLDWDDYERRKW